MTPLGWLGHKISTQTDKQDQFYNHKILVFISFAFEFCCISFFVSVYKYYDKQAYRSSMDSDQNLQAVWHDDLMFSTHQ